MNISDEAVESAARALYGKAPLPHAWETATEDYRDGYRHYARLALEAAAPFIPPRRRFSDPNLTADLMAKAWDEGEAAGQDNADSNRGYDIEHKYNPYRSEP